MPAATSPLATAMTSSLNWLAVTSAQPPEPSEAPEPSEGRRRITACGCSAARRKTTSARFAVAGICARAGMLNSRTVSLQPDSPTRQHKLRPAYRCYMRVHVVSDVHGRADALAGAGDGADALICLGDLLLFLDYADYEKGIFADLFVPDA